MGVSPLENERAPLGPYSLSNLLRTTARFLPGLIEHADALSRTFSGHDRLPPDVRIAFHLRMARVLRCPVCLMAFPSIARVAGLSGSEIDAALEGRGDALSPPVARTIAWAAAVAEAQGEMPFEWPEAARQMSMREREQVLMLTRLELLVHSMGLLFVPRVLLGINPHGIKTTES